MSMPAEQDRRYTVEEYLALEAASPEIKYEFRDGIIVNMREAMAMSGGSFSHALISSNVMVAAGQALKGKPCRAYSSELRVRIPRKLLYTYPDVTIICGTIEGDDESKAGQTATNPKVIIEVLAPSTESFDRGKKFHRYTEIPSLEEYVLISQTEPRVEVYLRRQDATWLLTTFSGLEQTARFASIHIEIPLREIFAGVEFPAE